jgi:rubredoxin
LIFVCKSCGFLFERSARPGNCPDCGKEQVEYADIHEKIAYLKGKEERLTKNRKVPRGLRAGHD